MHYSYLRLGKRDKRSYAGGTSDVRSRAVAPNAGQLRSTAAPEALELIYDEAWLHRNEALRRERFFKTGKGKRFLRNCFAGSLDGVSRNKSKR